MAGNVNEVKILRGEFFGQSLQRAGIFHENFDGQIGSGAIDGVFFFFEIPLWLQSDWRAGHEQQFERTIGGREAAIVAAITDLAKEMNFAGQKKVVVVQKLERQVLQRVGNEFGQLSGGSES
jgi:hypothetical protein